MHDKNIIIISSCNNAHVHVYRLTKDSFVQTNNALSRHASNAGAVISA